MHRDLTGRLQLSLELASYQVVADQGFAAGRFEGPLFAAVPLRVPSNPTALLDGSVIEIGSLIHN